MLVVSVTVVILFMVRTFLMAGEMSGSGDDNMHDEKQQQHPGGGSRNKQDGNRMVMPRHAYTLSLILDSI